jgi:hypothetical protein
MFSERISQYVEEYAEFHGIEVGHVRKTVDGPDERNTFVVRLDSYEHPSCETETYHVDASGVPVGEVP